MRGRRVVQALGSLIVFEGCSLLLSDDYSGAPPTANDSGTGTADGTASDASAPPDAPAEALAGDASADVDAGPRLGCAAAEKSRGECFDFDDGTDIGVLGLIASRKGDGAIVAIEPGSSMSAPHALRTFLPRRQATADLDARVMKTFNRPWGKVHAEWWMYLVGPSYVAGDKSTAVADFRFSSQTTNFQVYLSVSASGFAISSPAGGASGANFPINAWTHVVVELDTERISVTYGGANLSTSLAVPVQGLSPFVAVDLGLAGYNAPVPALDVRFDDVRITLPP